MVGVDPSYLTRIEHGDREPPRYHIVDAAARCLRLDQHEWDRLRMAAGYSPLSAHGTGWSAGLNAVARVLNDYRLSPEDRAEFEQIILAMASHWQPINATEG
jgi:transcriptional regulator with XRE-family HTH domain